MADGAVRVFERKDQICLMFRPVDGSIWGQDGCPLSIENLEALRKAITTYLKLPDQYQLQRSECLLHHHEEELRREMQSRQPSTNHRRGLRLGFVYAMLNKRNGYTKIGFAFKPDTREKTLQAEDPDSEMVLLFKGTQGDEARLHKQFAEKRIRGEWFNLTQEDLQIIGLRNNA